jgi:exodeoxyribonuclease V gamma subunit
MDYIKTGFDVTEKEIIQKHRRHAFHPQYFTGADDVYFSYSDENMLAAAVMQDDPNIHPFFEKGLSEPDKSFRTISVNDLSEFFRNPSTYIVEKRLGIFLKAEEILIPDRENFYLNPLERYMVEQEVLEKHLSGIPMDEILEIQKATGVLPHGNPGEVVLGQLAGETKMYAKRIQTLTNHDKLEPVEMNLEIDTFQVYGVLDTVFKPYQISMRFAKARPRDFIHAWIYHLALCSYQKNPFARKTMLVCKDQSYEFEDISNSREILSTLLKRYWEGLMMPLKFFPESSFAYAEHIFKNADQSFAGIKKALSKWIVEFGDARGESEDPYYKLCFSKISTDDIFIDDFFDLAKDVFSPILKYRRKSTY